MSLKQSVVKDAALAIRAAERDGPLTPGDAATLDGFSGKAIVATLQRLAQLYEQDPDACYVEIGVFRGLTLLSVAKAAPTLACFGIDNFAFLDPDRVNLDLVRARQRSLGVENVVLINRDFEDALEVLSSYLGARKVALLFVDGPHDYRSQLMCLELALPHLHTRATVVVDDSNYRHVRQANRDFLVTHGEFKLLFEAYTRCHPGNMSPAEHARAREGWWNGVNVLVRDVEGELAACFPPTLRSRELYENDHVTHASGTAKVLPHVGPLLNAIERLSPVGLLTQTVRLRQLLKDSSQERAGLYASMNTYSDALPASRFNDSVR